MSDDTKTFAIVELFGHRRIAGQIGESSLGGCHFVRVDVPPVGDTPGYTKLYGQGAIYAITFVAEDVARAMANSIKAVPFNAYEIPMLRQGQISYDERDEGDDCP